MQLSKANRAVYCVYFIVKEQNVIASKALTALPNYSLGSETQKNNDSAKRRHYSFGFYD
ncbi:hypothetical protein [Pseudanabaena sp. lw0831]|uniref:hypothetical protein n=1 Tax=Pseudanabaena sp. lw0831 TaxID=1357935 RepID=UPI0019166E58|nr:hypothetical protein [Pseudanabaena sp. lw0831]